MKSFQFLAIFLLCALSATTAGAQPTSVEAPYSCEAILNQLATNLESLPDSALEDAATSGDGLWGDASETLRTHDTTYYDIAVVTVMRVTQRTKEHPLPGQGVLVATEVAVHANTDPTSEMQLIWVWESLSNSWQWHNSHSEIYTPDEDDLCVVATNLQMARQYIDCLRANPLQVMKNLSDGLMMTEDTVLQQMAEQYGEYEVVEGVKSFLFGTILITQDTAETSIAVFGPGSSPYDNIPIFWQYDMMSQLAAWCILDEMGPPNRYYPKNEHDYNSHAVRQLVLHYWEALLIEHRNRN